VHLARPPQATAIAERKIAAAGLADRVSPARSILRRSLPKADVITMGMILHDWNLEKKKHLFAPPTTRFRAARSWSSRT
jgi:hypothetical protein